MNRFLSRYSALCVLALFLGVQHDVGVVLRPFDALVGVGGLLLVGRASVRGHIDTLRKPAVYYLFVATYTYRCLNGFFLTGVGTALKETLQVIEFVLLIQLVAVSTRTIRDRQLFFRTLLIGFGVLVALTAGWHISNGSYAGYKALGALKYVFSLLALLAFARYLRSESDRQTAIVLLIALLLMILSGERKGWMAFAGGAGMMYFVFHGGSLRRMLSVLLRPRVLIGGGTTLAVILIGVSQIEYVAQQFRTVGDVYVLLSNFNLQMDLSAFETSGSNLVRLYALLFTFRTVLAHPWFGVGTGGWGEAIKNAAHSGGGNYVLGAHSEYQRFAVENGLIGLGLYMLSWGAAIRDSVRRYHRTASSSETMELEVVGLAFFGAVINLFLGGGALNVLFMALAVGLLVGLENDPARKGELTTTSSDSG